MKNLARVMIALAVVAAGATFAAADKAPKCPVCKMDLVAKKDKAHPQKVVIKKKTWYCCAGCKMTKPAPAPIKKKG